MDNNTYVLPGGRDHTKLTYTVCGGCANCYRTPQIKQQVEWKAKKIIYKFGCFPSAL
jgi:hypothetical protein